jgi:kinesin family protein 6/9
MLEDEDGNCHLRNLSMHRANSEEDALNLLFLGNRALPCSEKSAPLLLTVLSPSRRHEPGHR